MKIRLLCTTTITLLLLSIPTHADLSPIHGNLTIQPQFKRIGNTDEQKIINLAGSIHSHLKLGPTTTLHGAIATKGSSPRSRFNHLYQNNRDFGRLSFQVHTLYLDQKWDRGELHIGRLRQALWAPTDMLWDTDIHPLGIRHIMQLRNGRLALAYLQVPNGSEAHWSQTLTIIQYQHGPMTIGWAPVSGRDWRTPDYSANTNTRSTTGTLTHNFNPVFGSLLLPSIWSPIRQFHSEWVYNPSAPNANIGLLVGFSSGVKKPKKWGDWAFSLSYRYLEKDAWLDTLPDISAANGHTGISGFEAIWETAITSSYAIALDLYTMRMTATSEEYLYIQLKNKITF